MVKRVKNNKQHRSKQQKKKGPRKKQGMLFLVIAGAIVIGLSYLLLSQGGRQPGRNVEPGDGILSTPIDYYDFGTVSVSKGSVSIELPLVNIGEEDLIVYFLSTSCGCTTVRVINDNKKGPVFGMSSGGRFPTNWQTVIKPGEQASLKITYDPFVHPRFRGPATRIISIISNQRTTPKKEVQIKVNQID